MRAEFIFGTMDRLLLWDGQTFRIVHEGHGLYYGITWDEKQVYVASRGWEGGESILIFDKGLNFVGRVPTGRLADIHQIAWFDGRLYITNTGANSLEVWDGKISETWNYSGERRDVDHINSVWADRAFIYVGEHRWGKPSRVRVFDRDRNLVNTIENMGRGLHNVYREGSDLYVCSSGEGDLLIRNVVTGRRKLVDLRLYHRRGYPRGLARVDGEWYIGMSLEARREERHLPGHSAVLVLDDGGNLIDKIEIDIGQIYEIRALEGDKAHNGLLFPRRIMKIFQPSAVVEDFLGAKASRYSRKV